MSTTIKQSPFKFLAAFEKQDRDFFFGRDEEIEEIYTMSFQTNILLIYGLSGVGKTSLLQCGLANRFEETDWLEITIRRHGDINESLNKELKKRDYGLEFEDSFDLPAKIHSLYLDFLHPIYLIFDQFEELFILGNIEEQTLFFRNLRKLIAADLPCKTILVMREEYIAYLYPFEKIVPSLFKKRLRVEPMRFLKAQQEVILKSTNAFNIELASPEVPKEIMHHVTEGKGQVYLPYLQVFLDKLYRRAIEKEGSLLFSMPLIKELGKIDDVLVDFLEERLIHFEKEVQESKEIALRFLKIFVSEKGTKVPLTRQAIVAQRTLWSKEQENTFLDFFTRQRILHPLENDQYELIHDSLALRLFNINIVAISMPPIEKTLPIPNSPLVGFEPLKEAYADTFFGRQEEIKMLFDKIVNESKTNTTLVYGPLSVGKTSLIRAGLIPRLTPLFEVNYLCFNQELINSSMLSNILSSSIDDSSDALIFHQFLKENNLFVNGNKIPLLIIDQFEELFFWINDLKKIKLFYVHLAALLNENFYSHLVIIIRDDYFSYLNELEDHIPNLLQKQHRVNHLNPQQLTSVIVNTAKVLGLSIENQLLVNQIAQKIKGEKEKPNLSHLQFFLSQLHLLSTN